jgi:hypothetical protein
MGAMTDLERVAREPVLGPPPKRRTVHKGASAPTSHYEVVESTARGNRFMVVDQRGDAEMGNWFVCSTWWREDADRIAVALNGALSLGDVPAEELEAVRRFITGYKYDLDNPTETNRLLRRFLARLPKRETP